MGQDNSCDHFCRAIHQGVWGSGYYMCVCIVDVFVSVAAVRQLHATTAGWLGGRLLLKECVGREALRSGGSRLWGVAVSIACTCCACGHPLEQAEERRRN